MTVKTKTTIENQNCEKCKYFDTLETDPPCSKCLKETFYSRFSPSYEETFREIVKDNTKAKNAMIVVAAE